MRDQLACKADRLPDYLIFPFVKVDTRKLQPAGGICSEFMYVARSIQEKVGSDIIKTWRGATSMCGTPRGLLRCGCSRGKRRLTFRSWNMNSG